MNQKNKIGILTFHRAMNYGSVMQAYALQTYLKRKLNIDSEIIDYSSHEQQKFYKLFVSVTRFRNLLGNFLKLSIMIQYNARIRAFRNFVNTKLIVSKKRYSSSDEVKQISDVYDLIITGSDQIWNVECADFSWAYLLEDIQGVKKISYAASMGGGRISDPVRYKKCLEQYTKISVREEYAEKIIDNMFCQTGKAQLCLDPTLLLDRTDYDEIASPRKIQKEYIFLYSVYHDEQLLKTVRLLHKKWNLPIVTLISRNNSYRVLFYGIKLAFDEGPEDFLGYIKYARFVLTNSFHGSVFSIIYGKEFYYLGDYKKDPRLYQLFSMIGISENCEKEELNFENTIITLNRIEAQDFSSKICNLRKESEKYISDALSVN